MKKALLILTIAASAVFTARAVDVTLTEPGTLASLLSTQADATTLKVSGPVDMRDFDFIANEMASLTSLDLSGATVRAYDGHRAGSSQQNFAVGELPSMAFAGMKLTSVKLPSDLVTIGDGALAGTLITAIEIPASVTEVRTGAFATCPRLTKAVIPATVTTTGQAIFRDCEALTEASFMSSRVGARTFAGCKALKSVSLSADVTAIGEGAFADCVSLTALSYSGAALTEIGDYAFYNTGLKTLDLAGSNGSLSSVGNWAFADNAVLASVSLPPLLYALGEGAFFNTPVLESFTAPDGYANLGDMAFCGASSLDIVNILPEALRTIGRYSLSDMSSIQSVRLPHSLNRIGDRAFEGCTSLSSMNAPEIEGVPALGDDVWAGLDKSTIELGVPGQMMEPFKAADQWREFKITNAGSDDITGDLGVRSDNFAITARFDGMVLLVSGTSDIDTIQLYDTLGRLLTSARADGSDSVAIDTSRLSTRVYIIRAISSDGVPASVKTIR